MRTIKHCLNKQLIDICQRSIQLEELSNKVSQLLPQNLATECQVGSFNKGCLILTTSNAAWASQLRYALPELRDALRKEAGMYQLTSIKINVIDTIYQPKVTPKNLGTPPLSEKAKTTIINESQHCSYQPLQRALLNLAQSTPDSKSTA